MKNLIALLPLIYLLTATYANAADYYYCDCKAGASNQCVAGSDANNGTTPSTPRQSFSNANSRFSSLNGGDSIKFCRGGSFISNTKSQWINNRSTSTSPVTVTDYLPSGQSSTARPIITKTTDSRMFDFYSNGHQEGYTFSNLDIRCTTCALGGNSVGFFISNDVDYVTVNNVSIDKFRIGVQLAESLAAGSTLDYITLKKLTITNGKSQGVLGGANNLTIENSYFENNGSGTVFSHNLYVSRGNNITIRGNELYRASLDSNGQCAGTSFVMHAKSILNNVLIEGNTVREDIGKVTRACWGMSITVGYDTVEGFRNLTIRGNKIINVGNTSIGLTACQNCIIENNQIIQEQQGFSSKVINVPDKTRGSNDLKLTNITIRNNSIYLTSSGTGITLGTEGTQHSMISNAIHYAGNGTFNCINANLPAATYKAIDYNVCYFPSANNSSRWEKNLAASSDPLGLWKGTGLGTNSKIINPGYTNPSLPQYNLAPASASSGVVRAGHKTLSAPKDFRGKTRDAQPDAGAFEYGTFNPPAKTKTYFN